MTSFRKAASIVALCFAALLVVGILPAAAIELSAADTHTLAASNGAGLQDVAGSPTGQNIGISNVGAPWGLAARIINVVLSLVGVLFFLLIVYAGFLWMTSAGNSARVDKAKKIFSSAFIGLVIVLMAYYLVDFVFEILTNNLAS